MSRRYSRNLFRVYWWVVVLAVVLVLRVLYSSQHVPAQEALAEGRHRVARVVDGDTLKLVTGQRIRLQGVDTPETVRPDYPVEPWGPEATAFTKQFVDQADGEVTLTFGTERLDAYGRHLAFVWRDDVLLNEELVRAGLARARLGYRYSGTMKRRLADAQEEARAAGLGIWSDAIPGATASD
ncbi:thermonuclease family protein [Aeoliella sp. ICT_H6.2]|uniref:Thermonuclease family protein n=1 Tax=Aeoliella straminimaris TaxID=2954799 RepID=A0A9X2FF64_9BACT|nr:thermonuclease family protein [Aeoliella straminimaris]MCO6048047.1 thermonuclease family protein [Aeoliella straminimaris]